MPHFICLSRLSHFVWLTNNKERIYMDWNLLVLETLSRVFWIAPSNVPSNGIVIVFMNFPVNYEILSCQGPVLWGTPLFNPELILKCFSHPFYSKGTKRWGEIRGKWVSLVPSLFLSSNIYWYLSFTQSNKDYCNDFKSPCPILEYL